MTTNTFIYVTSTDMFSRRQRQSSKDWKTKTYSIKLQVSTPMFKVLHKYRQNCIDKTIITLKPTLFCASHVHLMFAVL